jgi:GDP-4-dehydro-6-deoxy-D-mannose reductase
MTALVTGASGFLGRHVVARLSEVGIPVATLGRGAAGATPQGQAFHLADPRDQATIRAVMEEVRPSLVLHLAGMPQAEPVEDAYRVNVLFGVHLMAAACALPAPPRVLLAGSAAEYGPIPEGFLPVLETTACAPVSTYGITKFAQTRHGLSAAASGLPVVVARLFNVIGRFMPRHLALGAFAAQIQAMPEAGGTLTTGPLARERDFVEAAATAAVLVDLVRQPEAAGQVVNVCSGHPTSLAVLTQALIAAAGKPVTLREENGRVGNSDMIRHWGSAARLAALGHRLPPPDPARIAADLLSQ